MFAQIEKRKTCPTFFVVCFDISFVQGGKSVTLTN